MITKAEANKIRRAVLRLQYAAINNSWKGVSHPDDRGAIEKELRTARRLYNEAMKEVTQS